MEILTSLLYMLNEMSPYILLGFLIAGVIHAFIPQRTMARHLSGTGTSAVVKAALAGVPLPLCSCGVLPTAIGLRRKGASRAASTSFMIATPQTGVDSIAATWSMLGPTFAILRPIAALVTAISGGWLVGRTERKSRPEVCALTEEVASASSDVRKSFAEKVALSLRYGFIELVGSIGGWLVTGLIIAALITVYVPDDFFDVFGKYPLPAMLCVLIVAIPMYICATGSIPIAMSLMLKGLSPGTALVMLMAGPAANFASFALIRREMGTRPAALYILAVGAGAILFGLLIDYVLPSSLFDISHTAAGCDRHMAELSTFGTICSAILIALLIFTFIKNHRKHKIDMSQQTLELIVTGMNCPHCQASVTKAIRSVEGVTDVSVDLASGVTQIEGNADSDKISQVVREAGFDIGAK